MQNTTEPISLTSRKYTLNPTGLALNSDVTFKEWEKIFDTIRIARGAVHFWIGDALVFGKEKFGEDYTQVYDEIEFSVETIKKDEGVAKRIPFGRRRPTLSWSHHAEVAELEPEDQDKMLDRAEKDRIPVAEFRKIVGKYKLQLDVPEAKPEQLEVNPHEDFTRVQDVIYKNLIVVEEIEKFNFDTMNEAARDYFFSHLRVVTGMYVGILQKYDKQKHLPEKVE